MKSQPLNQFMDRLESQSPKKRSFDYEEKIPRRYINNPETLGIYRILPVNMPVIDYPYLTLYGTREINLPVTYTTKEGESKTFKYWVKILPKSAYMRTDGDREYLNLTAQEEATLNQAHELFDALMQESGANNKEVDDKTRLGVQRSLCRKKNYTLFFGHTVGYWKDPRQQPAETGKNFLFVLTAKSFVNLINENAKELIALNGGDSSWLEEVYNRKPTGRSGFLNMTVKNNKEVSGQAGWYVNVVHDFGKANQVGNYEISQEDLENMTNPLEVFLAKQYPRREDGSAPSLFGDESIFNMELMNDAIAYMAACLSHIRAQHNTGMTATQVGDWCVNVLTMEGVLPESPEAVAAQAPKTLDPLLNVSHTKTAQNFQGGYGQSTNPSAVMNANKDPFNTPPVAHIDPLTNAPVQPAQPAPQPEAKAAPFKKPAFAQAEPEAEDDSYDDLPF